MSNSGDETPGTQRAKPEPPAAPGQKSVDPSAEAADFEPAAEILRPHLRNPGQAKQVVAEVATAVLFHGPLPPPDVFKGYDEIVPGSAREILSMAAQEQRHRHRLEVFEMVYPYLGQLAGFVGFLASLGGAVYLAMNDRPTVAGLLLGVPSLGVIGWFINSRVSAGSSTPAAAPRKSRPRKRR
jgi:uncharacterized membrane protein